MKLAPKLQPFWFTPAFQTESPPVRFKLRPLTQQQMVEVEEMYRQPDDPRLPSFPTLASRFHAAMLSIEACDGIQDADGEDVRWPFGIDYTTGPQAEQLRSLIVQAGLRIIYEMNGKDWDALIKSTDEKALALEEPTKVEQPAESSAEKT